MNTFIIHCMNMENFKGKVYHYTNENGKVNTIEKDFSSQEEMNQYMQQHQDQFSLQNSFPSLFGSFDRYVNRLMDQRMDTNQSKMGYDSSEDREIEEYAKNREHKKKQNEEKKSWLEKQMEKFKNYVDSFDSDDEEEKTMRAKAQARHDYYKEQYDAL